MPPPLFACRGDEEVYLLHALDNGAFGIEIATQRGSIGVSTHRLWWTDVRTGHVTGQQGGHQSHMRLEDDERSYILFEGENGLSSDAPGGSYAGVALWRKGDSEPVIVAKCSASPMNRAMLSNVAKARGQADLPPLPEDDGNVFDRWY